MTDHDADAALAARVVALGEMEVGRRYVERQGRGRPADGEEWIDDAVDFGDGLSVETRYRLILSTIDAAGDDEQMLWLIGDRPVDHLVGDDPATARRFHAARSGNANVDRAFVVVQRSLREDGRGRTWWDNDFES